MSGNSIPGIKGFQPTGTALLREHPEYQTWADIKKRCYNPNQRSYANYGGRGIEIHPDWKHSSRNFLEWMDENLGPRPDGHTLDRIDVDGNYEPGNLRWASGSEQVFNQRRHVALARVPELEAQIALLQRLLPDDPSNDWSM